MEPKKSKKKMLIIGGIILLIIVALIIFFVVKNKRKKKKEAERKETLSAESTYKPKPAQRPTPDRNQGPPAQKENPAPVVKKHEEHKPVVKTPAIQQEKPPAESLPLEKQTPAPTNPVNQNSNLTDGGKKMNTGPVKSDAPFVDMVDKENGPE